eukprot:m.136463 g.136463  ORF g.136463 m.136463 type:complete len:346 (+) comp16973_c0_seq3:340-1377(+)
MAKWGEGDPRWIVEERADAVNVNNWHWTEKNATEWSKQKLTSLLESLMFEDDKGNKARTTEVTSVDGEASANNRKAKIILFYELVVKLKWKGTTADGDDVNGTIEIPNLSDENDIDEIDVQVSLKSAETPESRKVKDLVRKKGATIIQDQLSKWLKAFKEDYTKGMVLPTDKKQAGTSVPVDAAAVAQAETSAAAAPSSKPIATSKPAKVATRSLELTEDFNCRPMDLFQAFVDPGRVQAYTQSEAKIDAKIGGDFNMFHGNVLGKFIELVPHERIVQSWRFKDWPEGHFSTVTMKISQKSDQTVLSLTQTDLPATEYERAMAGWKGQMFQRMKAVLGLGTVMPF